MGRSRKDNERLDRLASSVKKGGGLPLPSFFAAILNELLDNGPADDAQMQVVVNNVGNFKASKVAETWGGPGKDEWQLLTLDLMEQLAYQGHVTRNGDDKWHLGEKFASGVSLQTIPERKNLNAAESVTVWPKEERDALEQASMVQSKATQLVQQPRGKWHTQQKMNQLRNSMETHGQISPILKTGDKRIIDGRHRYQIDPEWPEHVVKRADGTPISTDAEILATVVELNAWKQDEKLPPAVIKDIEKILGELAKTNVMKRDRVAAELHQDPARSNRAIAELVGVAPNTVIDVRAELETVQNEQLRIHCYVSGGGPGGKAKHSTECWCGEGDVAPPVSKEPTVGERIDAFLKALMDSGYVHTKNKEGREKLCAQLLAETEIVRSHGALEQRWDKMAAALQSPPPTPPVVVTPTQPPPEVVGEDSPIITEEEPVQACPSYTCPNCGQVVHP